MKKNILFILMGLGVFSQAQINLATSPNEAISGENAFMDVSSFSAIGGYGDSESKGLVFPETDLTVFEFNTSNISPGVFPTAFNGMIVYNTATGTTADPSLTTQTTVSPGFYYFDNPDGAANQNVEDGVWKPLGATGESELNIGGTETSTNVVVGGKEVYAVKSTFTVTAGSTAITLVTPSGITSLYRITIYKDGAVFATSLYSYDKSTGASYTGAPGMSVVYPAGTYDYVLEYLK